MTKEALKLALEALEPVAKEYAEQYEGEIPSNVADAITAIKEALANEALEKMAENARELGLDYEPAQEPVAWINKMSIDVPNQILYTAPQRTWVGLTRIELIKCGVLPFGMSYELYEAIEQALKERNT